MMSCIGCKHRNGFSYTCSACVGYDHYEPYLPSYDPRRQQTDILKELKMLEKVQPRALRKATYRPHYTRLDADIRNHIKKVIFNDPCTIIIWGDDTKTIVRNSDDTPFDPEKGLAMAISKKVLGDKGNYYNVFKKWLPKEETENSENSVEDVKERIRKFGESIVMGIRDGFGIEKKDEVRIRYLSVSEVSKRDRIAEDTVRQRCRDGYYKDAEKIKGKWRIPEVIG